MLAVLGGRLLLCCARRYRKKVEKDDDYIRQVKALVDNIEDTIKQNTSIDIYQVGITMLSPSVIFP
jgi:hypothetical protein